MELNEDKILDFLDGSLTGAEEEELLHRLAVSPERRTVLKQHLQLRELSSILAKKHNYIVPKVLTAQLFTSLSANGYAGPMYHAATDTDTLRQSLEANVGRSAEKVLEEGGGSVRRSSLIFSSVLSFIAGAFLVYLLVSSPTQSTGSLAVATDAPVAGESALPQSHEPLANTASNTATEPVTHTAANAPATTVTNTATKATHEEPIIDAVETPAAQSAEPVVAEQLHQVHSVAYDHAADAFSSIDLGTPAKATVATNAEVVTREGLQFAANSAAERIADAREHKAAGSPEIFGSGTVEHASARNWWAGPQMYANLEKLAIEKRYYGLDMYADTVPFIKRTMVSLRSGGGKAPGRAEDYTGSLVEIKLSADLGDWLVAKVSFGQFMPYETEALSIGKNDDGVRMLKLVPVLQYRSVVGAELGFRTQIFGATFEALGGFLSDLRNGLIPRAGIFTTLNLQENLSLQMGVEGALYTHDIRPSLINKQMIFSAENPVLTNAMRETETAGFIGPALELAWHF